MSLARDVRKRELLFDGAGRHMGLIPAVMALSATLSRAAQAEDQFPMQPFGGVCKYSGGGETTLQEWHNSQCLPVRCLYKCAGYGSQVLEPAEGEGAGGKTVAAELMRCTLLCLNNDVKALPQVGPDYPCRKLWEWPIDYPENWLPSGTFCESSHQRACMAGRCMSPTELVTDVVSASIDMREAYYIANANMTWPLRGRVDAYKGLADYFMQPTLLRAPGPLVTPDWKAIERQDYENALAAEAARQAEEAAYQAQEAARQVEAGEPQTKESEQPQESTP